MMGCDSHENGNQSHHRKEHILIVLSNPMNWGKPFNKEYYEYK